MCIWGLVFQYCFLGVFPPWNDQSTNLMGMLLKFEIKLSKNSNYKKSVTNRNYILNNFINYPEHSDLSNLVLTFWSRVEFKSKSLSEFEPSASLNKFSCSVSDTKDTAFQLPCKNAAYNFSDQKGRQERKNKEPTSTVRSSNKCF